VRPALVSPIPPLAQPEFAFAVPTAALAEAVPTLVLFPKSAPLALDSAILAATTAVGVGGARSASSGRSFKSRSAPDDARREEARKERSSDNRPTAAGGADLSEWGSRRGDTGDEAGDEATDEDDKDEEQQAMASACRHCEAGCEHTPEGSACLVLVVCGAVLAAWCGPMLDAPACGQAVALNPASSRDSCKWAIRG